MKIVRYIADKKIEYGIQDGESVQNLSNPPYQNLQRGNRSYKLSEVKLLPLRLTRNAVHGIAARHPWVPVPGCALA